MRKKIAIFFLFIFFVLTQFSNILREPDKLQIESSWEKLNAVETLKNIQIKILNQPCFAEFEMIKIKKVLEYSGIIEKVIIELHQTGKIIANLGIFHPTFILSSNQSYIAKFNSIPYYKDIRFIEPCLNKEKPFILIFRNSKGKIKATLNVKLKIIDIPTIK